MITDERKDRFTSQPGDFIILKMPDKDDTEPEDDELQQATQDEE